jgi:hypothetical protein
MIEVVKLCEKRPYLRTTQLDSRHQRVATPTECLHCRLQAPRWPAARSMRVRPARAFGLQTRQNVSSNFRPLQQAGWPDVFEKKIAS